MMTKKDMVEGFARGRRLIQEEWSKPEEIAALNECVSEGLCTVTEWDDSHPNYQCAVRFATGIPKP